MNKKRVLSGIRATGRLHLGNYLGAVKGMLELQNNDEYETLYMVADLHAITTPYNVEELRKNRREVILDYLAAGIDPNKSVLFQQADNPHHAELAFYLSSVVSIARMQHLPTFKDKVRQYPHHATMALLNYPVLMGSDILLYKANLVPVGIDQEPHLEVARELARKMNQLYRTDFPEATSFKTSGEYIPSLTGEGKMSKSVEGSYINLTDDLETIKKKIAKVPTDSGKGTIRFIEAREGFVASNMYVSENGLEGRGVTSLLKFIELFFGNERKKEYEHKYIGEGIKYSEMKNEIAEAIYKELQPVQEKRRYYEEHDQEISEIIAAGNAKATELARQTMLEVREKMGLK